MPLLGPKLGNDVMKLCHKTSPELCPLEECGFQGSQSYVDISED